jgi:hypothetical protein
MLQASEEVNADIGTDGHVARAVGGGVDERGGATPVLMGSVGEEDLREVVRRGRTGQSAPLCADCARSLTTHH